MMRIDSVAAQPDKAGRYTVKFDDGTVMRLYRQTVEDFLLYSGKEMDDDLVAELRIAAGKMSAKMRAVRIVSTCSVSKSDLEHRLIQKGESKADAKLAVEWMSNLELLDDEKTAQQIVQRCISKGYGRSRAKQALFEKHIPKDLWETVLADYPDQSEKILAFLETKLRDNWEEKDLRRAMDGLLRRGHSYQEIRKVLQKYSECRDFREEIYD